MNAKQRESKLDTAHRTLRREFDARLEVIEREEQRTRKALSTWFACEMQKLEAQEADDDSE